MDPRHIREYQAELFQNRKLSANSVGPHLAVLRFFYIKTLRRAWSLADTPYPKKTRHLPTILSREEVAQLLHAARNPGERILLMALYASGARNAELTHLKVSDIDSQRMVVHIRGGKGRKDRDVMLSPKLLVAQIQREYPERPKVGITEEGIRKGERRSHVEGIWADTEDRYRLGIVPAPAASSADYVAVVLRSSTPLWQAGEIKAEIRSTASPDIFTCTYFMANKKPGGTTLTLEHDAVLRGSVATSKGPFELLLMRVWPESAREPANAAVTSGKIRPSISPRLTYSRRVRVLSRNTSSASRSVSKRSPIDGTASVRDLLCFFILRLPSLR